MVTLARAESAVLAECEEIIERGLDGFIEVGNALLRIRNEKLYREKFDTFELYCGLKWGMSDRHARRMIDAAQVAGNLGSGPIGPVSESQVRPLVSLPAPAQREVWQEAVASSKNGKPTAKEVVKSIARKFAGNVKVGLHGKVRNTAALKQLKAIWNEATEADKKAFKAWIEVQ